MPASEGPSGSTRSVEPVVVVASADDRREGGRPLRKLRQERRAIQQQLERHANVELLPDVLLEEIWKAFEREEHRGRIQVFHFAGHASGSWLAVADEAGTPVRAHAGGLAGFLGRQDGLVVVFLNGCSTQEQVQRLRNGVPAVIATTDAILDEVAAAFAERFYAGLAVAKPLRQAFLDAEDFVKSRYGDVPTDVTRDAAIMPASGTSAWPWILDCDEGVESWCLGEGLERREPAPPEPRRSPRWIALGLATIVLGAGTWLGVQQLWSKPVEPEPTEPEPEPTKPTEFPFEMTLVPQRVVRHCSSSMGCSFVEVPPFCVAITEMVQSQWEGHGGPPSEQHGDELPANAITWVEALQMANRLSRRESLEPCYRQKSDGWDDAPACDGYRLPTDQEWSVLAEAHGKPTCDNANLADYDYLDQRPDLAKAYRGRFGDIAPFDCGPDALKGDGHGSLAPVGSMPRSGPFGVEDLQGNVAEWVWDSARDVAIVRGHSFAWPGREGQSPLTLTVERDQAVGVRYARRPIASDEPDAAPRCTLRGDAERGDAERATPR